MCGAQPEYRQRLLGPYDDSPEKAADAKYGIIMAFFDKVEEPEVDEAAHDFPSTELLDEYVMRSFGKIFWGGKRPKNWFFAQVALSGSPL